MVAIGAADIKIISFAKFILSQVKPFLIGLNTPRVFLLILGRFY
jgi:hypothetical protein